MFTRTLSALAATALTVGTVIASSAPADAAELERETVAISIGDLDLSDAKDQVRLERRIRSAARQICGNLPVRGLKFNALAADCHAETIASARAEVQLAQARRAARILLSAR